MIPRNHILNVGFIAMMLAMSGPATADDGVEFFEKKIRPALVQHCYECHSAKTKTPKGGLRLDTVAGIKRGGDNGPLFNKNLVKTPEKSLLVQAVSYSGDFDMPPKGKLPQRIIADFKRWVELGSPLPVEKVDGNPQPQKSVDITKGKQFWSFQPVRVQKPPAVSESRWVRTKLDWFILRKLDDAGLSPSLQADRATLIRRLSLDLIGLPPTFAELQAFVADKSPDAYDRLVDRLLASPHYGERWARHWLDVARYAEDNPTSESTCKPPLYPHPFRDWVINSLNADLPYDDFVRRQLAADLMSGLPAKEIAATGFLGLSPVYHKEPKLSRDVILAIVADEWDERIDTVARGFLGLTVACARCHDHKFDPIKREDYYSLAGVMASTQLVEWPLVKTDPKTAAAITDTRLAIVDFELRVSYAKTMLNTARETKQPTEKHQKEYDKLKKQLDALKQQKRPDVAMANAVRDAGLWVNGDDPDWTELDFRPGKPRDMPIFIRGSVTSPGKIVPRRFLEVLSTGKSKPYRHGSGRLELANAIVGESRGLAARVIVNRVWGWHFGQPLVRTPSNFGLLGDRPSHPELLDDLAARFIQNGWSLKWLHREIVRSAAYQQSSRIESSKPNRQSSIVNPQSLDPGNRLLWRMNRRRLEPEIWRDSVLFTAGKLNKALGGPSGDLDKMDYFRRTVYGRVSRQKPADILRLWDFPDAKFHAADRVLTTTPLQQLYLLNSEFMGRRSRELVDDVLRKMPKDVRAKRQTVVRRLFQRILLREPGKRERQSALQLVGRGSPDDYRIIAHSLLASNEFLFVD